jgi:hypothetical protein
MISAEEQTGRNRRQRLSRFASGFHWGQKQNNLDPTPFLSTEESAVRGIQALRMPWNQSKLHTDQPTVEIQMIKAFQFCSSIESFLFRKDVLADL